MEAVCELQLLLPLDVVANDTNVTEILVRDRIVAHIESSKFQMRLQTVIAVRGERDSPIFFDHRHASVPE